jgi:hypothetical protein
MTKQGSQNLSTEYFYQIPNSISKTNKNHKSAHPAMDNKQTITFHHAPITQSKYNYDEDNHHGMETMEKANNHSHV